MIALNIRVAGRLRLELHGLAHCQLQGRIILEIQVNERGDVVDARVVQGLGYGLDEGALDVARRMHFSPATRCSKPVASPFLLKIRFASST